MSDGMAYGGTAGDGDDTSQVAPREFEDADEGALDDGGAVDVPEAPRTGDPGVDAAAAALREAVAGPLDGQVAAYDSAHRALQDRLADVEG